MVVRSKDRYPAWERAPEESYEEFKKRFKAFYRKTLNTEYIRDDRKLDKITKFRAWEQMPGESLRDFKRRLKSEKRMTNVF